LVFYSSAITMVHDPVNISNHLIVLTNMYGLICFIASLFM